MSLFIFQGRGLGQGQGLKESTVLPLILSLKTVVTTCGSQDDQEDRKVKDFKSAELCLSFWHFLSIISYSVRLFHFGPDLNISMIMSCYELRMFPVMTLLIL